MEKPCEPVSIRLNGRFRVTAPDGVDLTPVGSKSQAMLALLATEPTLRRGRIWLQDKLWSDRGAEQASASLRQAIYQSRKALGAYCGILGASRKDVWLDAGAVAVSTDPAEGEFLEGLDIRDAEFDLWLAAMRAGGGARAAPPRVAPRLPLRRIAFEPGSTPISPLERAVIDEVSRCLRETGVAEIQTGRLEDGDPAVIVVSLRHLAGRDGTADLTATVEDFRRNLLVWSETLRGIDGAEPGLDLFSLCNRLVEVLSDAVALRSEPAAHDADADLLANVAVRKLFLIGQENLAQADLLLQQAWQIEKRGIFQAWRAQAQVIRMVERFSDTVADVRETGLECAAEALKRDPQNSNVLSAAANARAYLDRDVLSAYHLATQAVRSNRSNPLAWWALSAAMQTTGRCNAAFMAASGAHALARNTRLQFWTGVRRAISAAAVGEFELAAADAELSAALAPDFRPPLRYLTAIYAVRNQVPLAQSKAEKLRQLEPGFSIDRMLRDPEYPIGYMRRTGLEEALRRMV